MITTKLKIPIDTNGIMQLSDFITENIDYMSIGSELFKGRELYLLNKKLKQKILNTTKTKSITLDYYQLIVVTYLYHRYSTGEEITEKPQLVLFISKIKQTMPSNLTIAALSN